MTVPEVEEIRQLWLNATEESAEGDLERAHEIGEHLEGADRVAAEGYIEGLAREY